MSKIKIFLKNNYKIFIIYIFIFVVALFPLPYYVNGPGGITNIDDRVKIDNSYKSRGGFYLSYVSEYKGTIATCLISLFNKNLDIIKKSDVVIPKSNIKDTNLIDKIMLKSAYSNATLVAYKSANKDVEITNTELYIQYLFDESSTDLHIGDQLLEIDNIKINNLKQVKEILNKYNVNDEVKIKVKHNNKKYIRKAKLIKYKNSIIIGVGIVELNELKTNPNITYNYQNDEYGSSGGLMLSLNIYNSLTKEDITKGKTIVGTGTIDSDGNVGMIDGIKYKIKGAIKNKVDLFIVPNGNLKEALKVKKDNNYKIEIIGVDTFEEAIDYLKNKFK